MEEFSANIHLYGYCYVNELLNLLTINCKVGNKKLLNFYRNANSM